MKLEIHELPTGGIQLAPPEEVRSSALRAVLLHGYGGTYRDLLPLGFAFARRGFTTLFPEIPGHGHSPVALTSSAITDFTEALRCRRDEGNSTLWVGHSLGARMAWQCATAQDRVVAISPPMSVDFGPERRKELLSVLRPRWVRESKPMMGLAEALELLPRAPASGVRQLLLLAQKDLSASEEAWSLFASSPLNESQRIPHTDHTSILLHTDLEERIFRWIPI